MKFLLALLAGTVLAVLPVALAGAADPSQTPCAGVVVTDPAKDDSVAFTPLVADPGRRTGETPNLDIRSLYFTLRPGADGKPKFTAHIAVTNLNKDVPAEAGLEETVSWWAEFDTVSDVSYLKAVNNAGEVKFEYGKVSPVAPGVPAGITTPTATTGMFTEGPDGVVSIDWPADLPVPAVGTKLTGVYAMSTQSGEIQDRAQRIFADEAPEGTETKEYTVTACPAEQPTTTDTTTTTNPPSQNPPSQNPPSQQPPPQQPAQAGPPAPGSPLPATGTLAADVAVDKGKRRTAARRGLRARVRCSVQCRVTATATITKKTARKLRLGRKAMKIGTGKASITKAGRIPFYVKMTKKAKRALKRKGVRKFALTVAFRVTDNQGGQLKTARKKSTLR